jgi:hypothetical protein
MARHRIAVKIERMPSHAQLHTHANLQPDRTTFGNKIIFWFISLHNALRTCTRMTTSTYPGTNLYSLLSNHALFYMYVLLIMS